MRSILATLFGLASVLLTVQDWQRVEPGVRLSFPADHGAHEAFRTEWWYVTGQVEDETGRRFGFQFTVFRKGLGEAPPGPEHSALRPRHVYAGHLAVTDVAGERTLLAERLRRGGTPLARAATGALDIVLEDWTLARADGRVAIHASDSATGIGLTLDLEPSKPLVLHGEAGYSQKGSAAGNASAYVSWTRMRTTGTLTLDGQPQRVTGSAWFDHEFGSSVLDPGVEGWDWFGLQLDDGRELMLFHLRGTPGRRAGTLVASDGTARALEPDELSVEAAGSWTSPHTGATYPAGWTVGVPSEGLALVVRPLVADCELTTKSTDVAYWEGPVEISGSTRGRGYAELTGYAGTMSGRF